MKREQLSVTDLFDMYMSGTIDYSTCTIEESEKHVCIYADAIILSRDNPNKKDQIMDQAYLYMLTIPYPSFDRSTDTDITWGYDLLGAFISKSCDYTSISRQSRSIRINADYRRARFKAIQKGWTEKVDEALRYYLRSI